METRKRSLPKILLDFTQNDAGHSWWPCIRILWWWKINISELEIKALPQDRTAAPKRTHYSQNLTWSLCVRRRINWKYRIQLAYPSFPDDFDKSTAPQRQNACLRQVLGRDKTHERDSFQVCRMANCLHDSSSQIWFLYRLNPSIVHLLFRLTDGIIN